jgi:hypothetical protein
MATTARVSECSAQEILFVAIDGGGNLGVGHGPSASAPRFLIAR